jgi:DNA-binding MarR family transcriptional regulator
MHFLLANKVAALATAVVDQTGKAFGDERSSSAAAILQTLFYWGPLTATQLARIIGVSQPTMVRVADGLIREGLIRRHRKQARNVALGLTREGHIEAKRLQRARLKAVEKLVRVLNPKQAKSLESLLDQLLAAATDGRATARRMCRLCAHDICDGRACPVGSRATVLDGEFRERRHGDIGA